MKEVIKRGNYNFSGISNVCSEQGLYEQLIFV